MTSVLAHKVAQSTVKNQFNWVSIEVVCFINLALIFSSHDQGNASTITKILSRVNVLGKNLYLVGCVTFCDKSEVILVNNLTLMNNFAMTKKFLTTHQVRLWCQILINLIVQCSAVQCSAVTIHKLPQPQPPCIPYLW